MGERNPKFAAGQDPWFDGLMRRVLAIPADAAAELNRQSSGRRTTDKPRAPPKKKRAK
jgi:hypothetical protein